MLQRLRATDIGVAVIVCMLVAPAAWAQARGQAAIGGLVTDSSGAVMPGVTVEAASPALIEKVRVVVTDSQGQYKIIDLRPGTYSVTFSLAGFATFKRDGIELTPNATANVGAELRVGGVEETLTVSGASPLVDVQGVTQTNAISSKTLEALPGSRGQLSFAAITPSVVSSSVGQDVGGSKGEFSVRMTVHGNKGGDAKLLLDGMRYNTMAVAGTGKSFFMNPAAAQEITVELGGGGSAEYDTGGVHVNMVPKDGENTFNAYAYSTFANHSTQGSNHMHFGVPEPEKAVDWYLTKLGAKRGASPDRVVFGRTIFAFAKTENPLPSASSVIDHVAFSVADVDEKMKALQAAGVKVIAPARDVPGLFKAGFIEDPWGGKIELVQDPAALGFHHIHLRVPDPDGSLKWYVDNFGGERTRLKGGWTP